MKSMKTFVVCSVLALGALAAHAETLTMDVPFAFSAGGKVLPAGSYTVETSANTLSLRGLPGGVMMMVFPAQMDALNTSPKVLASFTQTTGGNVLSSVTAPSGVVYMVAAARKSAALMASPPAGVALSKRP